MNTYHVLGTLRKENLSSDERWFNYFLVNQEIEASTRKAARDHFEVGGWYWQLPPTVTLVTEAMKMERAGQPTLFDLEKVK